MRICLATYFPDSMAFGQLYDPEKHKNCQCPEERHAYMVKAVFSNLRCLICMTIVFTHFSYIWESFQIPKIIKIASTGR